MSGIADAIRSHPEVVKAAEELEHAILRAAEGAVLAVLKGALPFPFSLAAPLAAPIVDSLERAAEKAIDGALDRVAPVVPVQAAPAVGPALTVAQQKAALAMDRAAQPDATSRQVERAQPDPAPESSAPVDPFAGL